MSTQILSHSDPHVFTPDHLSRSADLDPLNSLSLRTSRCARSASPVSDDRPSPRLQGRASLTRSWDTRFFSTKNKCPSESESPGRARLIRSQEVVFQEKRPASSSNSEVSESSSFESEELYSPTHGAVSSPKPAPQQVLSLLSSGIDREQLKKEFHRLPQSSSLQVLFPDQFTTALMNESRNRYTDILPFEANRFQIPDQPGFYYNASYVLEGQGIAAQGPLPKQTGEFWKMVWHSGTPAIIMLVNLVEGNRDKCSPYWPQENALDFLPQENTLHFKAENLTITLNTEVLNDRIFQRTFTLEKGEEKRIVVQYHLTHWPDQGVINKQELAAFVIEMESLSRQYPGFPLLAHCSAGVGRTGTFFAVLEGYKKLKEGKSTPNMVFEIVSQLRKERVHMVQTCDQYILVHETLEFLKTKTNS